MDWVKLGEYGALVVALIVIMVMALGLFEVIRRRYRESGGGDRREGIIVECPNHIEGLDSTLNALVTECHTISAMNRQQIAAIDRNGTGIESLVESHKPVGGREWWKQTEQSENVQIEIRDGIKDMQTGISELVRIARKNGC